MQRELSKPTVSTTTSQRGRARWAGRGGLFDLVVADGCATRASISAVAPLPSTMGSVVLVDRDLFNAAQHAQLSDLVLASATQPAAMASASFLTQMLK